MFGILWITILMNFNFYGQLVLRKNKANISDNCV